MVERGPSWVRTLSLLAFCLGVPACKHQDPCGPESAAIPVETRAAPRPLQVEALLQPLPAATPEERQEPPKPPVKLEHVLPAVVLEQPAQPSRPVTPSAPRSGILLALELALDHRHDEARAAIKNLPADDQDFILTLLGRVEAIQNGELWPGLSGPQKQAILQALRGLDRRLSRSTPLLLRKVMYTDNERTRPIAFGEVAPRADTKYHPEDWVQVYAEVVNAIDASGADGLFNAHINTTIEIRGDDNQVYFGDTKPSQRRGSISPRTDSFINAWFTLPKALPPGHYQLVIKIDDLDSGRSAQQTLPLHVVERTRERRGNSR